MAPPVLATLVLAQEMDLFDPAARSGSKPRHKSGELFVPSSHVEPQIPIPSPELTGSGSKGPRAKAIASQERPPLRLGLIVQRGSCLIKRQSIAKHLVSGVQVPIVVVLHSAIVGFNLVAKRWVVFGNVGHHTLFVVCKITAVPFKDLRQLQPAC